MLLYVQSRCTRRKVNPWKSLVTLKKTFMYMTKKRLLYMMSMTHLVHVHRVHPFKGVHDVHKGRKFTKRA